MKRFLQDYRTLFFVILGALLGIGLLLFVLFLNHPAVYLNGRQLSVRSLEETEQSDIRVLEETAASDERGHSSFWLNSGGWTIIENDVVKTIEGTLPSVSFWRLKYRFSNPVDTENGYRPQNIFRLISQTELIDSQQEVFAQILTINSTDSPNRNESNGILLISRFLDSDNLYYAGIRVDGYAVIKEKRDGVYYTLALVPLFTNPEQPYDKKRRPNLIPEHTWLGLRFITRNRADGSVELSLYLNSSGAWEFVTSVRDATPIAENVPTRGGIRSDFMDAQFRGYRVGDVRDEAQG